MTNKIAAIHWTAKARATVLHVVAWSASFVSWRLLAQSTQQPFGTVFTHKELVLYATTERTIELVAHNTGEPRRLFTTRGTIAPDR